MLEIELYVKKLELFHYFYIKRKKRFYWGFLNIDMKCRLFSNQQKDAQHIGPMHRYRMVVREFLII